MVEDTTLEQIQNHLWVKEETRNLEKKFSNNCFKVNYLEYKNFKNLGVRGKGFKNKYHGNKILVTLNSNNQMNKTCYNCNKKCYSIPHCRYKEKKAKMTTNNDTKNANVVKNWS